jgi:hypothetical protein
MMATGDPADMLSRLRNVLPPWFPESGQSPVVDGILSGCAGAFAYGYDLVQYAALQGRIRTATGGWLDLIAWDFLGGRFLRRQAENDNAFRVRLLAEILRPRVTRAAISQAVADITGSVPRIIEPWRPTDVGVWDPQPGQPGCYWDVDTIANPFRWTNTGFKFAVFIEAVLPLATPLGNNAPPAFDVYSMAYDKFGAFIDLSVGLGAADEVYSAVNAARAAGITIGVKFVPAQTEPHWDEPGVTWDQPNTVWN